MERSKKLLNVFNIVRWENKQTNEHPAASLTTGAPPPCPPTVSATPPPSAPPGAARPPVSPPVFGVFKAAPAQDRAPAGSASAAPSRAPAAAPPRSTTPTSQGGLS